MSVSSAWGQTSVFSQNFTDLDPSSEDPSDYGFTITQTNTYVSEGMYAKVTGGKLEMYCGNYSNASRGYNATSTFSSIGSGNLVTFGCTWATGYATGNNTASYSKLLLSDGANNILEIIYYGQPQTLYINGTQVKSSVARDGTYEVTATIDMTNQKITSLSIGSLYSATNIEFMSSKATTMTTFVYTHSIRSNGFCTSSIDNVVITKKDIYSYTVNAVDNVGNFIKEITSGIGEKDATISYAYPRYINVNGTLYLKEKGSGDTHYEESFTLTSNETRNITYTPSSYTNVVYFSEAEDVLTLTTNGGNTTRCSMKASGRATSATKIVTLPKGSYKIGMGFFAATNKVFYAYKGSKSDENKIFEYTGTGTWGESVLAVPFTLTEPTDILVEGGDSNNGIDYIFITGTYDVDKGADMTGMIVNADMETSAGGGSYWQEGVKGWNSSDNVVNYRHLAISGVSNPNAAFTGTYAFENWTNAAGGLVGQMSQTITNLPNGVYQLQMAALVRTVNGQFIYGKSNGKTYKTYLSGANEEANDYAVIVIVENNELEIGLDMNGAGADWAAIDNARLTYMPDDATVSKTISAAGWATYCSPYALDFTSAITNLTNAYIITGEEATGGEGTSLTLTSVNGGTVPANTGLLLKGEGNCTIPVAASSSTDVTANKLVGVTTETVVSAGIYVLLNGDNGIGFYRATNDFTVGANSAYLPADAFSAKAIFYNFNDDTTGLETICNSENELSGEFFDLSGRKVAKPAKGLYIMNGKKVFIK